MKFLGWRSFAVKKVVDRRAGSTPMARGGVKAVPVNELMFGVSLPVVVSVLMRTLCGVISDVFITGLSRGTLATISLTFPLRALVVTITANANMNMGTLLSGSLNTRGCSRTGGVNVGNTMLCTFDCVVFLVLKLAVMGPFCVDRVKGTSVRVVSVNIDCLDAIVVFSFNVFTRVCFREILASAKEAVFDVASRLYNTVAGVVLSPVVVFKLLNFPGLNTANTTITAIIKRYMTTIITFIYGRGFGRRVDLDFGNCDPSFGVVKAVCTVNVPSVVVRSVNSMVACTVGEVLVNFSSATTTIFNICFGLRDFFFVPMFKLGGKVAPVVTFGCNTRGEGHVIGAVGIDLVATFYLLFINFTYFRFVPRILLKVFDTSSSVLRVNIPTLEVVNIRFLVT